MDELGSVGNNGCVDEHDLDNACVKDHLADHSEAITNIVDTMSLIRGGPPGVLIKRSKTAVGIVIKAERKVAEE